MASALAWTETPQRQVKSILTPKVPKLCPREVDVHQVSLRERQNNGRSQETNFVAKTSLWTRVSIHCSRRTAGSWTTLIAVKTIVLVTITVAAVPVTQSAVVEIRIKWKLLV